MVDKPYKIISIHYPTLTELQQRSFIELIKLFEEGKLISLPPSTGKTKCRLEDFEK